MTCAAGTYIATVANKLDDYETTPPPQPTVDFGDYTGTIITSTWVAGQGDFSFSATIKPTSQGGTVFGRATNGVAKGFALFIRPTDGYLILSIFEAEGYGSARGYWPSCVRDLHGGNPPLAHNEWGKALMSSVPIPLNQYTDIILIRKGLTFRLFLNGEESCSATTTAVWDFYNFNNDVQTTVGGHYWNSNFVNEFPGTIEEAQVYGKALSEAERDLLFRAPLSSGFIDRYEQELDDCIGTDDEAWQKTVDACQARGLSLCSASQYKEAYANSGTIGSSKYGYTSTRCAPAHSHDGEGHILMNGQSGGVMAANGGCHSDVGCWSDRYFRCCSPDVDTCESCPVGQYQDEDSATSVSPQQCKTCLAGAIGCGGTFAGVICAPGSAATHIDTEHVLEWRGGAGAVFELVESASSNYLAFEHVEMGSAPAPYPNNELLLLPEGEYQVLEVTARMCANTCEHKFSLVEIDDDNRNYVRELAVLANGVSGWHSHCPNYSGNFDGGTATGSIFTKTFAPGENTFAITEPTWFRPYVSNTYTSHTCTYTNFKLRRIHTQCEDCDAGQYQDQAGQPACEACLAGTYQDQTSQPLCTTCSPNTNGCGGTSAGTCQNDFEREVIGDTTTDCVLTTCEPGYGYNTATSTCELCDVTQFEYNKDASVADANGGSCATAACPVGKGWNDITAAIINDVAGNVHPEFNCVDCVGNTFSPTADTGQCETWHVCTPGEKVVQTPDASRDRTCLACEAGRYQDGTNADDCKLCSAGKWSDTAGLVADHQCKSCVAGKYSDAGPGQTSVAVCKSCDAGKYSDAGPGQTSGSVCKACISGRYSDAGPAQTLASVCKACGTGKWSDGTAQTSETTCTACGTGKWSDTTGQVSESVCRACSTGRWSDQTGLSTDVQCKTCAPGKFGDGTGFQSAEQCKSCGTGKYNEAWGADTCTACGAGKWSDQTALQSAQDCKSCGAGKWSTATGISSDAQCNGACSAGKWSSQTGLTADAECQGRCSAGKWSSATGISADAQCNGACSAGKWSSQTGLTADAQCQGRCSAGKWSTATGISSDAQCNGACSAGKWSSQTGLTADAECQGRCSAGKWSTATGISSDAQCNGACSAGKWSTATGISSDAQCNGACSAGKWSSQTGLTADGQCTPCGTGKKSTQTAATSEDTCASCTEGQYQESTGQTECKACPALTYQNLKTQSSCKPCVDHAENCGGSSPGTCASGYERNALEVPLAEANCINIDECERGTDNCHAQASCTDTEGSFFCTCNPGYLGDGVTCTLPTCEFTDGFVENTHVDGMELIFCTCTTHGLCDKTANTGMYCDSDTGCSEYPTCNEDSTDPNAEECHCGAIMCSEGATTGEYCYAPHDLCTSFKDGRRSSYQDGPGNTVEFIGHLCGEGPTSDDCVCGNTFDRVCYEGLDCTQGVCSEPALCSIGDGSDLIAQPCKCTEHVDCWSQTGRYCFQSHDQCRELPLCKHRDGVTRNLNECMCDTNECLGNEQYCHGDWNHMCSIAGKCEHEDGATKNIVDCWCDVTSPDGNALEPSNVAGAMVLPDNSKVLLCTNEPYCQNQQAGHERCDKLAETFPVQTDTGFDYIQMCEANGLLNTECFCAGATACPYGTYCIDHSYCDSYPKCEQQNGAHVEPKDCTCSQGNTCLTHRAPVCGVDGECTIPPCIAGGSGFSIDMPCRCDVPGDDSQECAVDQYCYNPPPDFGGVRGCVATPIPRCFNTEGREINDFGEACLCGNNDADRIFCKNNQYCNGKFAQCSDTPNPSCDVDDGSRPNGEATCLCGPETCSPFEFCDADSPTDRCYKQYCRDYEVIHPELCNRAAQIVQMVDVDGTPTEVLQTITYANGLVSENQTCVQSNVEGTCTPESFQECCRPCPEGNTFKQGLGLCVSDCDYAICTNGYVRAPVLGAPLNIDGSETWSKFYIRTELNPDWSDFCNGETCGPDDVKRCCVPQKQCADEDRFTLCREDKHNRRLIPNATCDNFVCAPEQCCQVVQCLCDGGVPRPGLTCSGEGEHECEYCHEDHWKDGLVCHPIYQCSDAEYEIVTPTPRLRNRICANLTVCADNEFISKNESVRAANPNTIVFNASVATSDRECTARRECAGDEYQAFAPNHYQDRTCLKRTACAQDEFASIQFDGELAITDATCTPRTVCAATHYIVSDGTETTDRVCDVIRGPCGAGEVETQTPIAGVRNRFCQTPRTCKAYEYQTQPPTDTQNRECANITACTDDEYEAQAPTPTSNRVCAAFQVCTSDEFESKAPVPTTSDRECTPLTLCDSNASPPEYETKAPTAFTDRVCTKCADETCRGCMVETDCEFDSEAKVPNANACSGHTCTRFEVKGTNRNVIFEPAIQVLEYGSFYRFDVVSDEMTFFVSGVQTQSSTQLVLTRSMHLREALVSNGIQQGQYVYFQIPMEHQGPIEYKPEEGTNAPFPLQRDCDQQTTFVGSKTGEPVCTSVCGEPGAILTLRTTVHDVIGPGEPCLPVWTSTPCICVPEDECPDDFDGECVHEDCKCPVDCVYTVNDEFEPCDAECGEQGFKIKNIHVITPAKYGGTPCPAYGAREMCLGPKPENDCDCYGNRLDHCNVCGGKNECRGCDGIFYTLPGFKKPVRDRCGNCLCHNPENPVCASDEAKQACTSKLKLMDTRKNDRSDTTRRNAPLIVGCALAGIFVIIIACTCRPKNKKRSATKYTALPVDEAENKQLQHTNNIIVF